MGTNGAAGCYVLVRSVTYAQSLMRALRTRGIRPRMVRSPKSLSENGCAQAVLIRESSPGVILSVMAEAGIPRFRIYTTENGSDFRAYFGS